VAPLLAGLTLKRLQGSMLRSQFLIFLPILGEKIGNFPKVMNTFSAKLAVAGCVTI
jgi:hypothetical protein